MLAAPLKVVVVGVAAVEDTDREVVPAEAVLARRVVLLEAGNGAEAVVSLTAGVEEIATTTGTEETTLVEETTTGTEETTLVEETTTGTEEITLVEGTTTGTEETTLVEETATGVGLVVTSCCVRVQGQLDYNLAVSIAYLRV